MTGLQLILKQLGVNIDAKEVESEFARIKELIPKFAADANEILKSLDRKYDIIIETLARHEMLLNASNDPHVLPAGIGAATQYLNGERAQREFPRVEGS